MWCRYKYAYVCVYLYIGIIEKKDNLWAGFSGAVTDSCLWHILLMGSSIFFLFPCASVSPVCAVHNYKCSFDHEASVVPELFAVRRTSLLAQQWLSDGNLNSPVLSSLAGGPDKVGGCLEKQTAGDTKLGSEKPSLAARGKSQNFLDRRAKCLPLLLSELSSRSKSWTHEGAYGGRGGRGSPQSGTLDTLRGRMWGQISSSVSSPSLGYSYMHTIVGCFLEILFWIPQRWNTPFGEVPAIPSPFNLQQQHQARTQGLSRVGCSSILPKNLEGFCGCGAQGCKPSEIFTGHSWPSLIQGVLVSLQPDTRHLSHLLQAAGAAAPLRAVQVRLLLRQDLPESSLAQPQKWVLCHQEARQGTHWKHQVRAGPSDLGVDRASYGKEELGGLIWARWRWEKGKVEVGEGLGASLG